MEIDAPQWYAIEKSGRNQAMVAYRQQANREVHRCVLCEALHVRVSDVIQPFAPTLQPQLVRDL